MSLRLLFQALRRRRRLPDSGRRREHRDRRIERRAEPRVGRRRADRLVPQAAPRFGTTYRLINLIVLLQLVDDPRSAAATSTCSARPTRSASSGASRSTRSRCWCCATSEPDAPRPWRVPLNVRVGGVELPLGLLGYRGRPVCVRASINLFTKQVGDDLPASRSRCAFFVVFVVSERIDGEAPRGAARRAHRSVPAADREGHRHRALGRAAGRRAGAGARLQHADPSRLGRSQDTDIGRARRRRADRPAADGPDAGRRASARIRCSPTTSRRCSRAWSRSRSGMAGR